MTDVSIAITQVGAIAANGLDARLCAAAVKAGFGNKIASSFVNLWSQRIPLGALPDRVLPMLRPEVAATPRLFDFERRLLRLAAPALQETMVTVEDLARVYVAVPAAGPGVPALDEGFLARLAIQSGAAIDVPASRLYEGTTGFFAALLDAASTLAAGAARVIVGGVDAAGDPMRLAALEESQRLHSPERADGFTPGEGAAFLVLEPTARVDAPLALLHRVAREKEPGHHGSREPHRGEGLCAAFSAVLDDEVAVRTVFAGLNGEELSAKEWGIAFLRHYAAFSEPHSLEHPADLVGDLGAAHPAWMAAVAAIGLADGAWMSPALVWSGTDEMRGALLMSALEPPQLSGFSRGGRRG